MSCNVLINDFSGADRCIFELWQAVSPSHIAPALYLTPRKSGINLLINSQNVELLL